MKVDLAHVSDIEKRMTVVVPAEAVDERIRKAYQELKKNIHLRGFRPGKAPIQLLERYFKAQVEEDVINRIVQDTYYEALKEVHAEPVSQPKIENGLLERGKEFSYTAVFEIKPEITVQGYTDIEIDPQQEISVSDEEIDREVEYLRERFATLKDVTDRGIQRGDYAVLDITAVLGGRKLQNISYNDFFIEIESAAYLPGFADKVVGLAAGQEKKFSLDIPGDYHQAEIAGKTVELTVRCKTVKEKVLPQLDDEFAKDVGDYENLDMLKTKLREQLLERKKQESELKLREKIFDTLIQRNPFPVPRALVDMQIRTMLIEANRILASQGVTLDDLGESTHHLVERYREPAERSVRASLLLEAVARQEGLSVDEEDFQREYERIASQTNQDLETVKAKVDRELLRSQIMEKKALDFIMARAKKAET